MKIRPAIVVFLSAALLALATRSSESAQYVTIYGGPAYDATTGVGYHSPGLLFLHGSAVGSGVAVISANKYTAFADLGRRPIRWDFSGAPAMELGDLGTDNVGKTDIVASAINPAGTVVGYARKFIGGANLDYRAVRWDASGTTAIELDHLGTSFAGSSFSVASAINAGGVAVGTAEKYVGGQWFGTRAVRWDATGTTATELGTLGSDGDGFAHNAASAINNAGTAVGVAEKYSNGTNLGNRAVRWEASGTAATELGNLGVNSSGVTGSEALAINNTGVAVGYATKFDGDNYLGTRAIRWDALGTDPTELENLGTDSSGVTNIGADAVNGTGTIVGNAAKYTSGVYLGRRAVRWAPMGTAITELGNLGTNDDGLSETRALAINEAGAVIGWAEKYAGGISLGKRAVLWNANAAAIDLNTLVDPNAGWILIEAFDISDDHWVSGIGQFDPDGYGPLDAYDRAFLLNISSIVVPEPQSLALAVATLIGTATFFQSRFRTCKSGGTE